MNNSLLVHIGFGKTGSTSIQTALRRLEQRNELCDISYPRLFEGGHNMLVAFYMRVDRLPRGVRQRLTRMKEGGVDLTSVKEGWLRSVSSSKNLVISSEFLSLLSQEEIGNFVSDLKSCGHSNIKVLLYVRDPADLYLSLVQQGLKASSRVHPPSKFLTNYRSILENWLSFLPEAVEVRAFDRSLLRGNDVVQDFFYALNEIMGTSIVPTMNVSANTSLSREAMVLLQHYRRTVHPARDNMFEPDSDILIRHMVEVQRTNGDTFTKPELKPDIRNAVLYSNREDITYLRDHYGIQFSHHLDGNNPEDKYSPASDDGDVRSILLPIDQEKLFRFNALLTQRLLSQ